MRLTRRALLSLALVVATLATARTLPRGDRGGWLLVANKGDQALGIIDPIEGRQVAAVPEGGITGHEVIASPDGTRAFVPIYGDSGVGKPGSDGRTLAAIDLATRTVTGTLDFGKGVRPHCPMFGPKDGLLYVTTELDESVTVVDPKALTVVGRIPTGQAESHMLAITRDGRRGYTANVGPGTVSVLDLEKRSAIGVIPISAQTQRISLSVDDRWAFTADQTSPRLIVIDTIVNAVARRIDLPAPGYGTAPTPDGRFLLVAVPSANKVAVIDFTTWIVERTIDVPAAPQEVLVRPDGQVAYVSCDVSGKVAAIRTSDWRVEALIDAGKNADGLAWAQAAR
jgi:DNA-binding beta-propeller fold protein YncE